MSEYLGFIALVPRRMAGPWIQHHMPSSIVSVLRAFASDDSWEEGQLILPALGRRLALTSGGITLTARQYTTRDGDGDMLAVAYRYAGEWIGPSGKFAADVRSYQSTGMTLVEIVDGNLDEQIKQALFRV